MAVLMNRRTAGAARVFHAAVDVHDPMDPAFFREAVEHAVNRNTIAQAFQRQLNFGMRQRHIRLIDQL